MTVQRATPEAAAAGPAVRAVKRLEFLEGPLSHRPAEPLARRQQPPAADQREEGDHRERRELKTSQENPARNGMPSGVTGMMNRIVMMVIQTSASPPSHL